MVAVGRSMMSMPKLLLADEMSIGLAPYLIKTLYGKLLEANRTNGLTLLMVEQNSKLALEMANKALLIQNGRLVLGRDSKEIAKNDMIRKVYWGVE